MADYELSPEQRYQVAKQHMICPQCGSDLVRKLMVEADPKGLLGPHADDDVGLKCSSETTPPCTYLIFGGEKL